MINAFRKLLRPTLRQQLEDGVREALRRYADRRTAPDLRVYASVDLVPPGMNPNLWARDEADHLRRFAAQWAQDNGIARAGLRVEVVVLDTKREFAHVKPLGLDVPKAEPFGASNAPQPDRPLVPEPAAAPAYGGGAPAYGGGGAPAYGGGGHVGGRGALLEVVSSETLREPVRVDGEVTLGRKPEAGVQATGDRYMSGRHARFRASNGRVTVTDLDSKNRTFVNEQPIPPHQERPLNVGDTVRMGNTVLRLTSAG
ncbi:MAG TPA: FHA domain-containing protein [Longimicrobium sp.]|nr:FHA domain-containing protein [Longimicrobium sp.]